MARFPYRAPKAVLTMLAVLAGPVAAQVPQPTVPPSVPAPVAPAPPVPPASAIPPAPTAPAVDPQVRALFSQAIAAHQALTALSATITMASTVGGADTGQTITLAFQKPNQARIAVAGSAGPAIQLVSNGKTVTAYVVRNKSYRVFPIPTGMNIIAQIVETCPSLLAHLIGQPEALRALLAQPGVTAQMGPAEAVGPIQTDTVYAALPAPGGSIIHFTFDIGQTDHLLHRLTQTQTDGNPHNAAGQSPVHTETVTAIVTTPTLTAADFTFVPPPGVTKATLPELPAASPPEPGMHDPRLVKGAKPFALKAKDLSGKPLSLTQYKGHVVLMDFWATWCGPCVGEMPNVIAAYEKYHARGFDVVGISLDESRPALTAFIAQNNMPWRQLFDGKGWRSAVPRQYGVMAIPFGLLIGRDGKIAAVDVRGPALTAAIKQALAKKATASK